MRIGPTSTRRPDDGTQGRACSGQGRARSKAAVSLTRGAWAARSVERWQTCARQQERRSVIRARAQAAWAGRSSITARYRFSGSSRALLRGIRQRASGSAHQAAGMWRERSSSKGSDTSSAHTLDSRCSCEGSRLRPFGAQRSRTPRLKGHPTWRKLELVWSIASYFSLCKRH